jgi:TPR repeat protein
MRFRTALLAVTSLVGGLLAPRSDAQVAMSSPLDGVNGGAGFYADQQRSREQEEAFVHAASAACDRRDLNACTVLAGVLLRPQHVPADTRRAIELFSRACDGGVMTACGNLGAAIMRGEGEAPDRARALSFMKKGCDGGDLGSCVNLGAALVDKQETPAHVDEGMRLLKNTCDKFASACHQLGAIHLLGLAGAKNVPAALTLYERACSMGLAMSCGVLGQLYGDGRFVPRDVGKAFGYMKQACDKGSQPACSMLASANARRR